LAGKSARPESARPEPVPPRDRLDKWLCQARFFKSRGLAAEVVATGHCRINGQRTAKPGHGVGRGDVLTFPQGNRIRVVRVLDLATRRGPAAEAQALYDDLDAAPSPLE